MKRFLIASLLLFFMAGIKAQSVEDGNKQLYYQNYGNAQTIFSNLTSSQPANAEAWYGLTKSYIGKGAISKAAEALKKAPADIHNEPWYLVSAGTVALAEHKKDAASAYFTEALKKTREKDAAILAAVADAHTSSENGDAAYAVTLLQKAISRDKRNANHYVALGDAYRKNMNSSEAYKFYKEAIEKDAAHAAAYYAIADIFLSQKNEDMYMDYFEKSLEADQNYSPTLKKMYAYYFYKDAARALDYYNRYAATADKSSTHLYDLADLYYINKKYDQAIEKANEIVSAEGADLKPRIYKLIGYSYAAKSDSASALDYMTKYFQHENDTNFIVKDFEIMGDLLVSADSADDAVIYYTRAAEKGSEPSEMYATYWKLANISEQKKDFEGQAKWLEKYYNGNDKATNVDLFKWALANYRSEQYEKAADVFTQYTEKYPDQSYGFYWLARTYAAMDPELEKGLAVPHYKKLLETMKDESNNPNYKTWMVEAYGFLAAYEANTEKDYPEAIGYFQKVLELDPENTNASRYISILEKADSGK